MSVYIVVPLINLYIHGKSHVVGNRMKNLHKVLENLIVSMNALMTIDVYVYVLHTHIYITCLQKEFLGLEQLRGRHLA